MTYRPDIEGLRALAILLVVAAHAGVLGFSGGYIGVDVFFVISGYLITGLLVAEHRRAGKIDFARFYARRFRRLLPALLLMLLVTAVAGWLIFLVEDQPKQAVAGGAAALWISNLHFAFDRIDYFGTAAESNMYLHTWSLGVEEQFYLVWPLLISLLLRRKGSASSWLTPAMIVLVVVSFAASLALTQLSTRYAFYLMPARAWQFAAGAILFLQTPGIVEVMGEKNYVWAQGMIGWLGVVLLVCALLLIDANTPYPGAWAILPTLGTVCLIFAASSSGNHVIPRALSVWPMQVIGRFSYSWYLWHWPVLILGTALLPVQSAGDRALLVAISLVLAVLSYLLIERPIRRNAELIQEPGKFIAATLACMALAVFVFLKWYGSAQEITVRSKAAQEAPYRIQLPRIYSMGCDDWYQSDRLFPCFFGTKSAPKVAVVIGDSIGLQWFPAYERVFAGPEWRLVVLTKSSCPMVDRPIYSARIGREFTECAVWRNRALDYIADIKPDIVVLGSTHRAEYIQDEWIQGTRAVLSRIAPNAGKVAIMRSTPLLPFDGPACARSESQSQDQTATENICSASAHDSKNDQVAGWLALAASGWSNVSMVDMNDLVCPEGTCHASLDGALVFRDTQHLNTGFVASLSKPLAERLGVTDRSTHGR